MKESFSSIADTRHQSQIRHGLYETNAMTIAAVIGNCDGWDELEDLCHSKVTWLRELMGHRARTGIGTKMRCGKDERDSNCAATSLKSVDTFALAMRKHWRIENGLLYCLNASLNEDRSRIRKDPAPDDLAVVVIVPGFLDN